MMGTSVEIFRLGGDEPASPESYISDPISKAKSVVLTEEGVHEAERLFKKLFCEQQEHRMKRAAQERKRTLQVWRRHLSFHEHSPVLCPVNCSQAASARVGGYGAAGNPAVICWPRREALKQPTPQQQRANRALQEWPYEW